MDGNRKTALQRAKNAIIKDLEVKYILQPLIDQGVLDERNVFNIKKFETLELQAAHLVETLIYTKSNEDYDIFLKVLENGYIWLAELLPNYRLQEEEDFHNALLIGDVPKEPPHYVERTNLLSTLRKKLKSLVAAEQLILCGRTGSGKSTLSTAAICDKYFLKQNFNNKVFWVDLKNVHNSEELIPRLYELAVRISQVFGEFNLQIQSENVKLVLRKLFTEHKLQDSLLILDNVSFVAAVDAFNIGFKMLVTTQNHSVRGTYFLALSGGFTKDESLLLFKKALGNSMRPQNFEKYALEIHNLCRGEPIVISLIASLIETRMEDFSNNFQSWEDCIKLLKKQKYNLNISSRTDEVFFGPIRMCFEILKCSRPDLYEKYKMFAVLVEEVNITHEVLETIWKLNKNEVKSIMDELSKRSLVLTYYNTPLKMYVYCVHHMLLAFLKKEHANDLSKMHMNVVLAYSDKMENNAGRLPIDNYISQYIGYHLKNAHAYDLLRSLYFNLEFLDGMIKAKGRADVLRDFSLYKNYLIVEESDVAVIEELQRFIKIHGKHLHDHSSCDIVKCGLGLAQDSIIFKKCVEIANRNPRKLYFTLQAPEKNLISCSLNLNDKISTAAFISFTDMILIATGDGIILWEQNRKQKLCSFIGHETAVTLIQLSADETKFLSVSKDGCVKIWNLDSFLYDFQGLSNPRLKQKDYHEFYHCKEITNCSTCLPNEGDGFISASFARQSCDIIVTGSLKGKVTLWKEENDEYKREAEISTDSRNYSVKHVAFSLDDLNLIICFTLPNQRSRIVIYSLENQYIDNETDIDSDVTALFILPGIPTGFITVGYECANVWGANFKMKQEFRIPNGADIKCSTITTDKKYFVASSSDCNLYIWEILSGHLVQKFSNIKGIPFCLEAFVTVSSKVHVLLLELQDNHTLNPTHIESNKLATIKNTQITFAEHWEKDKFLLATTNFDNKLQIVLENVILAESEELPHTITSLCFDVCGSLVYFGLEDRRIGCFDIKTRQVKLPLQRVFQHGPVTMIKCFKNEAIWPESKLNSRLVAASPTCAVCKFGEEFVDIKGHNASSKFLYISEIDQLICVSKDCIIDTLSDNLYRKHFYDGNQGDVTGVALSPSNSLLVTTLSSGTFLIFELEHGKSLKLKKICSKNLGCAISCCSFSYDGKLIALGLNSGNVVIWSVQSEVVLKTLQLHKSRVGQLLFSPQPELVLLSVGEQLAWWDLSKVPQMEHESLPEVVSQSYSVWRSKGEVASHLLGEFRLCGGNCNYVSSSYDFSKFFTIDNNGNTYFMMILNNS